VWRRTNWKEYISFLSKCPKCGSRKRDGAKAENESKKVSLLEAMEILAQPEHPNANRAEQLLNHFAKIT